MSKVHDLWKNSSKKDSSYKGNNFKKHVSCWTTHPVYKIGEYEITGGSCTSSYPDVDVFIALDSSGKKGKRSYPWNDGVDIYFKIADMGVPKSLEDFKKLLSYTAKAMKAGKKVFVGCIGGHGRTGLFLAALTKVMIGDEDATTTVRENYCHKAVESTEQIKWLKKHFGIKEVKGTKSSFTSVWGTDKTSASGAIPFGTDLTENWITGKVTDNKSQKYLCAKGTSLIVNND